MGPGCSVKVSRAPTYSIAVACVRLQDCHLLWSSFPERSSLLTTARGLIRVRSPLLTESRLISFPPGTEMFQFPGFARPGLCIQPGASPSACAVKTGCPIRKSPDQSLFDGSPELFAVCRVLHRLYTPRHPPYTLSSLTTFMSRCGQHQVSQSERERTRHTPLRNSSPKASHHEKTSAKSDSSHGFDTRPHSTFELVKEPPTFRPAAGSGPEPPVEQAFRIPEPASRQNATGR